MVKTILDVEKGSLSYWYNTACGMCVSQTLEIARWVEETGDWLGKESKMSRILGGSQCLQAEHFVSELKEDRGGRTESSY